MSQYEDAAYQQREIMYPRSGSPPVSAGRVQFNVTVRSEIEAVSEPSFALYVAGTVEITALPPSLC